MWHDEAWCIDDLVVVQDQIQVEGTRRARIRALAAELFLDIEQEHEKFARGEGRLPHCYGVQENRLFADTDRCRVMKARRTQRLHVRAQRIERRAQVSFAIATGEMGSGVI